jgi:hypothetical protein
MLTGTYEIQQGGHDVLKTTILVPAFIAAGQQWLRTPTMSAR